MPREITSDQGSRFLSAVMKMCMLLSLKQLVTTPYPICGGLIEKLLDTLKNMLRQMCAKKPRDWDRYVGPLVFAYREVTQDSLGYSPFEVLYGRTVRGPVSILRELMTTVSWYRLQLQNSQTRQKKYYYRKIKIRTFEK